MCEILFRLETLIIGYRLIGCLISHKRQKKSSFKYKGFVVLPMGSSF